MENKISSFAEALKAVLVMILAVVLLVGQIMLMITVHREANAFFGDTVLCLVIKLCLYHYISNVATNILKGVNEALEKKWNRSDDLFLFN